MRRGGAPEKGVMIGKEKTESQLLEYAKSIYPTQMYKIQKLANKISND